MNVHLCVAPSIGIKVKRLPVFLARNEMICGVEPAADSPT
jgi:hypothetical protein